MFLTQTSRYLWSVSSIRFNFLYCCFTMAAYNIPFIKTVFHHDYSFFATILTTICVFAILNIITSILFIRNLTKPLAITFCLLNTSAFYFMNAYGIVIDKIMLLNVLQTDIYEVSDMLNLKMILYLLVLFVFPSYIIYKTHIVYIPKKQEIYFRLLMSSIYLLICGSIIGIGLLDNSQMLRQRKYLKNSLVPANYIGAIISVIKIKTKYIGIKLKKISDGAKMLPAPMESKKNLIVVVIGESARDANFSLSGYKRRTNEPLEKYQNELIYFNNFYSCGTATAISVPCIFSPYPRVKFKPESEKYTENVLDIIDHAGYKLLWRENNTDCKDNCNRIEQERFCHVKECPDEILLKDFISKIKSTNQPTLIVLHQRGSHGPLYAQRYPKKFEIYTPVCKQKFLQNCTREEIVNAYDNTIYYTSYMLAQTIEKLKKLSDEYDIALFFTSDHGQSLGENNIYMHSAPYDTAPDEQKHIPTLFWFSANYIKSNNLDMECIRRISKQRFSHDNVFHTLLGLSRVTSPFYNSRLDILAACRR